MTLLAQSNSLPPLRKDARLLSVIQRTCHACFPVSDVSSPSATSGKSRCGGNRPVLVAEVWFLPTNLELDMSYSQSPGMVPESALQALCIDFATHTATIENHPSLQAPGDDDNTSIIRSIISEKSMDNVGLGGTMAQGPYDYL